ncbi:Ktr system potassium uptake protein B [Rubinisphaera italica]|uniref:Ktr system potassium uptake protein B n=1 Tax=Rubinisphaera italica TaxID=2527969 RepID=A0A5C5XKT3_9PLAN|nr:Ktr system potassium uptake protein B [Rubinisphaera italica]
MLKFFPGLYRGEGLGWTDAVFTSTSAVCVTGLIVVDTATYFTPLGQAVILMLIQLGGLGMLVLTSVMISALGGRPSLQTEKLATGSHHVIALVPARQLILDIVRFTFAIEALGALQNERLPPNLLGNDAQAPGDYIKCRPLFIQVSVFSLIQYKQAAFFQFDGIEGHVGD